MGEVGMSLSANSLALGRDCRGEIFYFDRTLNITDDQPLAEPAKGLAPPSPGEISDWSASWSLSLDPRPNEDVFGRVSMKGAL